MKEWVSFIQDAGLISHNQQKYIYCEILVNQKKNFTGVWLRDRVWHCTCFRFAALFLHVCDNCTFIFKWYDAKLSHQSLYLSLFSYTMNANYIYELAEGLPSSQLSHHFYKKLVSQSHKENIATAMNHQTCFAIWVSKMWNKGQKHFADIFSLHYWITYIFVTNNR